MIGTLHVGSHQEPPPSSIAAPEILGAVPFSRNTPKTAVPEDMEGALFISPPSTRSSVSTPGPSTPSHYDFPDRHGSHDSTHDRELKKARRPRVFDDLTIAMNESAVRPRHSRRVTGAVARLSDMAGPETADKFPQAMSDQGATHKPQHLFGEAPGLAELKPMDIKALNPVQVPASADAATLSPEERTKVINTTSPKLPIKSRHEKTRHRSGASLKSAKAGMEYTLQKHSTSRVQKSFPRDTHKKRTPHGSPDKTIRKQSQDGSRCAETTERVEPLGALPSPRSSGEPTMETEQVTERIDLGVPSERNNFQFKEGNKAGHSAEELEKLLCLPKREPPSATGRNFFLLNYNCLGERPARNHAHMIVERLMKAEAKYQRNEARARGEEWSDDK